MTATTLAEWQSELQRRLIRAEQLVFLGLPDPGFDFLAYEIHRFKACRAVAVSQRMGRWLAGIDAAAATKALSRMGQNAETQSQKSPAPDPASVPNGTAGAP